MSTRALPIDDAIHPIHDIENLRLKIVTTKKKEGEGNDEEVEERERERERVSFSSFNTFIF
jgi:hypothetical protein